MATSPNYGWLEPDNTDLVKNGALAIRTLGNAIDSTMATMTPKSIVDAKGDLIAATANDTPARLAVGANGETLVADSSTATGLRYQTPKTQNAVYNSGFDVWQRGTSIATGNGSAGTAYTADRWQSVYTSGSMTTTRQATNDTTNLPNIQYCARVQRNSGQTSTQNVLISQTLETADSIRFTGQTVTLSFWARAGANYSGASNGLLATLVYGTGTDQNVLFNFNSASAVVTGTKTLTTTWQRFSITGTVSTTATELGYYFYYPGVGTAGANDYFEITGVQLETGSVATPFNRMSGSIQGELAACQRYYFRNAYNGTGTGNYIYLGDGQATATTTADIRVNFPVTMRNEPQAVDFSGLIFGIWANTIAPPVTAITIYNSRRSSNLCILQVTASTASLTAGNAYYLLGNGSGTSYVGLSAEL
jgi:hypothetical protein